MRFSIRSVLTGSRFAVGSSSRSTSGRVTSARAIATRCISPPESVTAFRSARCRSPTISSASCTRESISDFSTFPEFQPECNIVGDRCVQDRRFLEDHRHAPADRKPDRIRSSGIVPSIKMVPVVGASRRSMRRRSDVLPLPLGPMKAKDLPARISRSIDSRIVFMPALREIPFIRITYAGLRAPPVTQTRVLTLSDS